MPPIMHELAAVSSPPNRKLLPYNLEAEKSVVGGILLYPKAFHQVADLVEPGDFYHPAHAALYQAMIDLDGTSRPIDQLSVVEQMRASDTYGKLRGVNGEAYFAELFSAVVTIENIAW